MHDLSNYLIHESMHESGVYDETVLKDLKLHR